MLVLSRKKGQAIEIPDLQIVIRVLEVRRSKVQLGIEAPRHYRVERGELCEETCLQDAEGEAQQSEETVESPQAVVAASSGMHADRGAAHQGAGSGEPLQLEGMCEELARLEAEVSAVAELADARDRAMARQVASDALRRIESLTRSLRLLVRDRRDSSRPLAELIRVRADVLRRLRAPSASSAETTSSSDSAGPCAVEPTRDIVREHPLAYQMGRDPSDSPRSVA